MSVGRRPDDGTRGAAFAIAAILAGLALGAAIALAVTLAREPRAPQPVWVSMRIRWSAPSGRWLGVRLHRAYRTQAQCVTATPTTTFETLGRHSYRMRWACVEVRRAR